MAEEEKGNGSSSSSLYSQLEDLKKQVRDAAKKAEMSEQEGELFASLLMGELMQSLMMRKDIIEIIKSKESKHAFMAGLETGVGLAFSVMVKLATLQEMKDKSKA
jgi:hypothetical protein